MAAEIAAVLGDARRKGRAWRCRCPLHGGRNLTLRDGDGGRVLATCWGGCDRRDLLAELRRRGLLDRDHSQGQDHPASNAQLSTTFIITVTPNPGGSGGFAAYLADQLLVGSSRQPFCDSARRLLELGYPADALLVMRHHGGLIDSLHSTIGTAAKLTVEENRHGSPAFRLYRKAPPSIGEGPPVAPIETAGTSARSPKPSGDGGGQ